MSSFKPKWLVKVNGTIVTKKTVANLTVTSGRTDIYRQPVAGYCSITLINLENENYPFNVGTGVTVEIKNSAGTYVPIFGGYITDIDTAVQSAGNIDYVTTTTITALGALSKLPKYIDPGDLAKDFDGNQIYALLKNYLYGSWNQVPASTTWATYTATTTWANAQNSGVGEIDQPGSYEMIKRDPLNSDVYSMVAQIANSAFGVIYEDSSGRIGYADAVHRQTYLSTNGYTILDANQSLATGIQSTTKSGDLRNKYIITYNYGGTGTYTAQNTTSQTLYGLNAEAFTSSISKVADATSLADRYIELRSIPYPKFESITFPLGNSEISNSTRDSLLGIFLGKPIWIQNLPPNINEGSFQGYVEGWTFRASYNDLSLTFNASPVNFSQVAVKWYQVNAAEAWNTLVPTLTWINAIGAVA